jgi:hypothetical protein
LLAAASMLVAAAPAAATEDPAAAAAAAAALLEQFLKGAGSGSGGFLPESDEPGAAVGHLWGDLAPAHPGGPLVSAQEFLTRFGPLLGFSNADPRLLEGMAELSASIPGGSDGGGGGGRPLALVLTPSVGGVPFVAGALTLNFMEDGRLVGVSGRARPVPAADKPAIDAGRAVAAALDELARRFPGSELSGDGMLHELLEDDGQGRVRHVFSTQLAVGHPPRAWRVAIAGDGSILDVEPGAFGAVPDGHVFLGYPQRGQPVLVGLDSVPPPKSDAFFHHWELAGPRFVSAPMGSHAFRAASSDGHFRFEPFVPGKTSRPRCFVAQPERPANARFVEVNVYHHLMKAYRMARMFGAWEVDGGTLQNKRYRYPGVIVFDVEEQTGWLECAVAQLQKKNASPCCLGAVAEFNPGDYTLRFFPWDDRVSTHPGLDVSLIYHEYAHFVHIAIRPEFAPAGFPATSTLEARAVAEGWADYFAATLLANPVHGMVVFGGDPFQPAQVTAALGPLGLRRADSNLTVQDVRPVWIDPKNKPKGAKDVGQIHFAGQVFARVCWDLNAALTPPVAVPLVVSGLRRAPIPHSFRNVAIGLRLAARSDHAATPDVQKAVDDALRARGL